MTRQVDETTSNACIESFQTDHAAYFVDDVIGFACFELGGVGRFPPLGLACSRCSRNTHLGLAVVGVHGTHVSNCRRPTVPPQETQPQVSRLILVFSTARCLSLGPLTCTAPYLVNDNSSAGPYHAYLAPAI